MIVMAALPLCANFGVQFESIAVVEKAGERCPAVEKIVDGLCGIII
jgi:hypothetical protein